MTAPDAPSPQTAPLRSRALSTVLRRPFSAGFLLTLGGLAAFLLGTALANLSTVLVSIAFALFIALGLDPLVRRLSAGRLSRGPAIAVVCGALALALTGVLLLIIPTVVAQVSQFVREAPSLVSDFQRSEVFLWLETTFGDQVGTLVDDGQAFLTDPVNIAAIGGGVLQVGTTLAAGVSGFVIVVVLSLYFLASLTTMKAALTRLAPARSRALVGDLVEQITASVGTYLSGMVVLAFINALFAFVMHLVLGLPFPQLMAVAAFCITLIPLVGSVLFWAVASVLALVTSPVSALIFALAYLVYMQLEAYLLTPRVMSRTVAIPGSLVVIGALAGGTLLGLLGALIAIPVVASILLVVQQVVYPRQDAKV